MNSQQTTTIREGRRQGKRWLNRNVASMSLTSFLGDFSHEAVTTILPAFAATIGIGAEALGMIEGVSDATSSFTKLGSGYYADKSGKKKSITVLGYTITGFFPAVIATASSFWQVFVGRVLGWFGRGARGPPRDAMLSESVEKKDLGKAFGLHRAGDTLGAIMGPVLALFLLPFVGYREIMWYSVIPGILAAIVFALFVTERLSKRKDRIPFFAHVRNLSGTFKRFLIGVGIFGIADYSHTLLILYAITVFAPIYGLLQASVLAATLYIVRNIVYAAASFPVGYIADHLGKKRILAIGYLSATLMNLSFILVVPDFVIFLILFSIGGFFIATEDALEGAISGEILSKNSRSIGYGVLGTVNGIGDFVSSSIVGFLWTMFLPFYGFAYAAVFSFAGALAVSRTRIR